jgi:thioredoxin reductase (NADPH)
MSETEKKVKKVVIIGSGPAGWSAAIYASRANLEPLVFEGADTEENRMAGTLPLGQLAQTTEVENYAGFPAGKLSEFLDTAIDKERRQYMQKDEEKHAVTGPELMELMRQQAVNFGTRVITDDVVDVNAESRPFTIKTLGGDTVQAHTVIVATGASANWLGLESETNFKNRGVSACAVCDGALPRFRDVPVAVVGGGDSAVEEATYLSKFASTVYLVHRREELRASQIMQERAFENDKIKILWNREVEEVLGSDDKGVENIKLKSTVDDETETLEVGGLFLAIGHTPNTSFLNGLLDTNEDGYVKWTKSFRTHTSVEGIFAAGDVADDYYRQAITSAGTGCMAALDAERYLGDKNIH